MCYISFGAFFPVLQPRDTVSSVLNIFYVQLNVLSADGFSHDKPDLISCHCHCGRSHRFADMDSLFLKPVLTWNFAKKMVRSDYNNKFKSICNLKVIT